MNIGIRRVIVTIFVSVCLGLVFPGACFPVVLENVRVGFHKDRQFTRVVLDLMGERSAKVYRLNNRLFEVVLPDAQRSSVNTKERRYSKSYVRKITIEPRKEGLTVLIETALKKNWVKSFFLAGQANKKEGYRLVLDFFSSKAAFERENIPNNAKRLIIAEKSNAKLPTAPIKTQSMKQPTIIERSLLPEEPAEQPMFKAKAEPVKKTSKTSFNPLSAELQNAFNMPVIPVKKNEHVNKQGVWESIREKGDKGKETSVKQVSDTGRKDLQNAKFAKIEPVPADVFDSSAEEGNVNSPNGGEREITHEEKIKLLKKRIRNAEEEIANKRYVEALSLLSPVQPEFLPPQWQKRFHLTVQRAAFFSEDYQFALKHLEVLLKNWKKLYIDYPEILKHTGESLYFLKRYGEAPRYLLWYYNLFPSGENNDLLLGKVAECLLRSGEKKLAIQMFKFVVDEYKATEGALISRIRIAEIIDENEDIDEEAIGESPEELYEEVINLRPRSPIADIARAKLASWYYKHKRYQEGAEVFNALARRNIDSTMLLEVKSNMEELLTDWVKQLHQEHKFDDIIHVYEVYNRYIDPSIHPEYLYYLAESYRVSGRFTDAIHFYGKALNFSDSDLKEKSLLGMGICYLKLARPEKALTFLSRVKTSQLANYARFFIGKSYIQLKNYSSAVSVLKQIAPKDLKEPRLFLDQQWWLGFAYYQMGDIDNAKKCFEQILATAKNKRLKLNPSRLALVLYYDANCELSRENYDKAYSELEKALPLATDKKLRKAISENMALLFIKISSVRENFDSNQAKKVNSNGSKINEQVSHAVENKAKIKKLQEELKEQSA